MTTLRPTNRCGDLWHTSRTSSGLNVRWRLVRDGLCEPAQTGPKPWQHASTWEFQQLRQVPEAFVRLAVETAELRCYAERYRDLFDGYCKGSLSQCAWAELQWHWEVSGKKEGRQ